MSALGALVVSLSLEHAAFTKGLDKSSQEALRFAKNSQDSFDKFSRSAKDSFNSTIKGALSLTAGLIGVSSALGALGKSINQLAALDDLSQKTGSAVEQLSRLQKVAIQYGQDFGLVENSLTKLAKGLGDLDDEGGKANTALKALGINSKDLSGNLRDPADLMVEVAKKLQDYKDGASKAAIANDLFGKSGADLLPYLNDLAENFDRFKGVSAESAAQAAAFQDKLGSLKEKVSTLGTSIASEIIPALDQIIGKFLEGSEKGGIFQGILDGILEAGKKVVFGADETERAAKIQAVNARIQSDKQKLRQLEKAGREEEAAALKKDIETQIKLWHDLINVQSQAYNKKPTSPYQNPTNKPNLVYNSGSAADIKTQMDAAKKAATDLESFKQEIFVEEIRRNTQSITDKQKEEEEAKKKQQKLDDDAAEDEYKRQLKVMDIIQDQANKNFDEAQKRQKELADEAAKASESINQSLTDALLRGFESGKGFAQNFRETLINMFKTMVLQPVIKFLIDSSGISAVLGALSSAFSGTSSASSLVASSGGSGSLGSVFGGLKDIISAGNGSIVSSIESLGTFLSTGNGGLGDTLGGFIGQYSAQIADVLPYAGAFMQLLSGDVKGAAATAVGTAIGSIWGPIGGAIGGALGSLVGGMFGGGHVTRNKYYANSSVSDTGTSLINAYGNSDAGYSNQALAGTANSFGDIILTYAKAFGASVDKFTLGVNYQQKYDTYALSLGNQIAYNGANADFQFKTPDIENGIAQAFLVAIKKGFVNLPEYIQSILNKSTLDVASAKANLQIVAEIKTIYDSLNDLPPVFEAIRYALVNTTTLDTVDKLKSQFAGIQTYTNLFYTESEKFDTYTKQLITQFGALNETLPTSRDEYRALVDSFEVVDLATQAQFDSLVALAPAMNEYFNQLQAQKDLLEETTGALRDLNSFTSLAEYRQYKGVSANYGATLALDNTANYRSGNLSNSLSGQGVVTGDKSADVVSLLKELRDYMKQNVIAATNSADLLDRFDRAGMPARA